MYANYHTREGADEASWDRLMGGIFREAVEILCASRRGSGRRRLLDVGCGFGGFVAAMRDRGWDAEGVDPSPVVVAAAVKRGRPVRLGTLEGLQGEDEAYDAITLFYVLEHLPDPLGALEKAWRLLSWGGTILIRVPHTTPILRLLAPFGLGGALFDPPFHLYDFSPAVLHTLLRRAGYVGLRTFPGQETVPARLGPRLAASFFGTWARWLHAVTRGAILFPGVSKTTLARKPSA